MLAMAVSSFAVILIPFVFTALVITLVKAPKVGAVLIGAVLLMVLAGVFGLRLAPLRRGGFGVGGVMELVILLPFVFTLFILLMTKAPKAGIVVLVAVVAVLVLGAVFVIPVASHRQASYDRIAEGRLSAPVPVTGTIQTGSSAPALPEPRPNPAAVAPIWSEGVENEYEADIYPSKVAAVRALGRRMAGPVSKVADDPNALMEVVLFQEGNVRSLVEEFGRTLTGELAGVPYAVEADLRNIKSGEVGVTLRLDEKTRMVNYSDGATQVVDISVPAPVERGRIVATALAESRRASAEASFFDKPWVDDFGGFASEQPERQFMVARSWETCTSENEAKTQAIRDACDQVSALVGRKWATVPGQRPLTVNSTDLLEGGFVVDQFVQSFDGMSGRFWRQAMLIDTSAEKLSWLESRKVAAVHVERRTWAGMILSALGVLVVIVAVYFFLNMATRGYYVWSLRIAGVVLAVAGVVSIFLVLR